MKQYIQCIAICLSYFFFIAVISSDFLSVCFLPGSMPYDFVITHILRKYLFHKGVLYSENNIYNLKTWLRFIDFFPVSLIFLIISSPFWS